MTPPGMILRMAMSAPAALEPLRPRRLCAITPAGLAALQDDLPGMRLTPARRRVLETLRDRRQLPAPELSRLAGGGPGGVRHLVAAGYPEGGPAPAAPQPDCRLSGPPLSPA